MPLVHSFRSPETSLKLFSHLSFFTFSTKVHTIIQNPSLSKVFEPFYKKCNLVYLFKHFFSNMPTVSSCFSKQESYSSYTRGMLCCSKLKLLVHWLFTSNVFFFVVVASFKITLLCLEFYSLLTNIPPTPTYRS